MGGVARDEVGDEGEVGVEADLGEVRLGGDEKKMGGGLTPIPWMKRMGRAVEDLEPGRYQ